MCVGQPFLGVLHSQERMGRAHHESCSGGRLCWLSVARLPPPPLHRIHCILYWPKNSQGPRRSLQGGRQLTLQAQSFPAYGLLHHKAATTKKTVFPPVFHFLHLLAFQEGKCYLPEVWSPLSNHTANMSQCPCFAFLFLFLAAIFSNKVGSLHCRSSSGWAVFSLSPAFLWNNYFFSSWFCCCWTNTCWIKPCARARNLSRIPFGVLSSFQSKIRLCTIMRAKRVYSFESEGEVEVYQPT